MGTPKRCHSSATTTGPAFDNSDSSGRFASESHESRQVSLMVPVRRHTTRRVAQKIMTCPNDDQATNNFNQLSLIHDRTILLPQTNCKLTRTQSTNWQLTTFDNDDRDNHHRKSFIIRFSNPHHFLKFFLCCDVLQKTQTFRSFQTDKLNHSNFSLVPRVYNWTRYTKDVVAWQYCWSILSIEKINKFYSYLSQRGLKHVHKRT